MLDQVGLPDAGWSNQNHILLRVFGFLCPGSVLLFKRAEVIGMIIMVANCNRERFLSLVLLDYKPVEMRFDVARQKSKNKFFAARLRRRLLVLGSGVWLCGGRDCVVLSDARCHYR